jgi:hypothetical protein
MLLLIGIILGPVFPMLNVTEQTRLPSSPRDFEGANKPCASERFEEQEAPSTSPVAGTYGRLNSGGIS